MLSRICRECGREYGPQDLSHAANFKRAKCCSAACMHAYKRFAPKHADRMFWPKIDRSGGPDACWPALKTDPRGYARFLNSGPYAYAHRTAWLLTRGPIPDGMEVAHRCDVRRCCNPAHFFLATHDENMKDMKAKGRQAWGERAKRNKIKLADAKAILAKKPPRSRMGDGLAVALAADYNLSVGSIYAIWAGRTWVGLHNEHPGDAQ